MSCLAEQAKILVAEAMENNLDAEAATAKWRRWDTCGLCEQQYHGVVRCALGWACWKTYVGRTEMDQTRRMAMETLGTGLYEAKHHEDALSVQEAELSMKRRIGSSESCILVAQSNLALAYQELGRLEEALRMRRDVYSGRLKLNGIEHSYTLIAANHYADSLHCLQHFDETKSLLRKMMPVAQRVLGDSNDTTLRMRLIYARALCLDTDATLDDLREAVATLEDTERTARRVFGGAHPLVASIERDFQRARAGLNAREAASA